MSFLTYHPDLSNTIFTDYDLNYAREYLSSVICCVDSPWLKKPKGLLGHYWNNDSPYSACFLIDVARTIYAYEHGITQRSIPLFPSKVHGILNPPSDKEFIENLSEFQVAFVLAQTGLPLDIDPLVPEKELLRSQNGQRPKTPDFAIELPDGNVLFDVTVLHVDALDKWDQCIDKLTSTLEKYCIQHQINTSMNIELPFPFFGDMGHIINSVKKNIKEQVSGSIKIGSSGKIGWETIPFIITNDSIESETTFLGMSSPIAVFGPSAENIRNAFARTSCIPTMPTEDTYKANELLFKSLRNTLNHKQKQMPHDCPLLLIIRLGHSRLLADKLMARVRDRIWPNSQYDWLTGIILFQALEGFSREDTGYHLTLYPNPEAHIPASKSLVSLFSNH